MQEISFPGKVNNITGSALNNSYRARAPEGFRKWYGSSRGRAEGASIEAPKAPRGVESGEGSVPPPQKIFCIFLCENNDTID